MNAMRILVLGSLLLILSFWSLARAEVYHITKDSAVTVVPSAQKISIQFDSTLTQVMEGTLFDRHPCLDPSVTPAYVGRGFWIYGISSGYEYATSAADLLSDSTVNRAIPVYRDVVDSAEYRLTDLIVVRFDPALSSAAMASLLAANGLTFVDSMSFSHGWLLCALRDTVKSSPLEYGNRVCLLPEVVWAGAEIYSYGERLSEPTDPYYVHQYYLKDRDYPYLDVDIDADSAWMIPLADSNLKVAVIDDGIAPHWDLPQSRLEPGFDAAGPYRTIPALERFS